MNGKSKEILFSAEQINQRVTELASDIVAQWQEEDMVVIALMKGGLIFLADLIRSISRPLIFDLMRVSSYGQSTESSGQLKLVQDVNTDLKGKTVLLVDDILDTGVTLSWSIEYLKRKGAKNIKSCVLLDKPSRRKVNIEADYCGFKIDDYFVIGYGMDYGERYRNLDYIAYLRDDTKV